MNNKRTIILLLALFAVLMSLPWLFPHMGAFALFGLVPLLCAERIASQTGVKRFFWWYYLAFVLWNALTTWWVCMATVGGGVFASLANALQMAVIFSVFRLSKKRFTGSLPYIFLAVMWIAWERWYLVQSEISWPWIVLGNAFARSTSLIQWYDLTGALGGSLWIWAVNLAIFGIMVALSDGRWFETWNKKARIAAATALTALVVVPIVVSLVKFTNFKEDSSDGTLEVVMAQSNFNPYEKRVKYTQREQNAQAKELFQSALKDRYQSEEYPSDPILLVIPETFTGDVCLNDVEQSSTWKEFHEFISDYPNSSLLLGASTYELYFTHAKPSILARKYANGWYRAHNSAILTDSTRKVDIYHKMKMVVGVESTPYPRIFVPLDDMLGGVMGRDEGQDEVSVLTLDNHAVAGSSVKVGVPICYESIYPEHCVGYIEKGAQFLSVITNDGWWGNTPGYRQHFSYSRLRAIETRRDIARCANTGISAFINQRGDVVQQSGWWAAESLRGVVNLTSKKTFFVRYGDIVGRVATFVFVLLFLALLARLLIKQK